MNKNFDYKAFMHFCFRHSIIPVVKENELTRKKLKPGLSKSLIKRPIWTGTCANGLGLILTLSAPN